MRKQVYIRNTKEKGDENTKANVIIKSSKGSCSPERPVRLPRLIGLDSNDSTEGFKGEILPEKRVVNFQGGIRRVRKIGSPKNKDEFIATIFNKTNRTKQGFPSREDSVSSLKNKQIQNSNTKNEDDQKQKNNRNSVEQQYASKREIYHSKFRAKPGSISSLMKFPTCSDIKSNAEILASTLDSFAENGDSMSPIIKHHEKKIPSSKIDSPFSIVMVSSTRISNSDLETEENSKTKTKFQAKKYLNKPFDFRSRMARKPIYPSAFIPSHFFDSDKFPDQKIKTDEKPGLPLKHDILVVPATIKKYSIRSNAQDGDQDIFKRLNPNKSSSHTEFNFLKEVDFSSLQKKLIRESKNI